MKEIYNIIWLWLSSFGVMFAILSFLTEINIFKNEPNYKKGLTAIILGTILFFVLPYKLI
jgi:hypothetical protein